MERAGPPPVVVQSLVFLSVSLAASTAGATNILTETDRIVPVGAVAGDQVGAAVAMDENQEFLVLGANGDASSGPASGAAYLYQRDAGMWSLVKKLIPSDGQTGDNFGLAVAMSGDVVLVGALWDDDNGINAGSAYTFRWNGFDWVQGFKLTASDGQANALYGSALDVDGDVAVIGAKWDSENGTQAGAVYVYRYDGIVWREEQKITPADAAAADRFGASVDVHGNRIAIGSPNDDDGNFDGGAVYVYEWDGITWGLVQKVVPSDSASNDRFGHSVGLDDCALIGGAVGRSEPSSNSGAVFTYLWDGNQYLAEQKLQASDAVGGEEFGHAVALQRGNLVVGAPLANTPAFSGAAYVFRQYGEEWVEQHILEATAAAGGEELGHSVALVGLEVVTGSWQEAGNLGAVHLFRIPELAFRIAPTTVQTFQPLTMGTVGGEPGGWHILRLVAIDAVPANITMFVAPFNAKGQWTFDYFGPPAFSGLSMDFQVIAKQFSGKAGISEVVTLTFE